MRASWDETWLRVAVDVARRSLCYRAQVGAVIVSATNRIVATGYNGPPAEYREDMIPEYQMPPRSCRDFPCPRAIEGKGDARYDDCVAIHAEANALLFCDRREREGGTIYVSGDVCFDCAKLIANSGLRRVVVVMTGREYRDPERGIRFMREAGLDVQEVAGVVQ